MGVKRSGSVIGSTLLLFAAGSPLYSFFACAIAVAGTDKERVLLGSGSPSIGFK